jgi:hypothetical protein
VLAWPQAKTIVVLGDEHDVFHSCLNGSAAPLVGIQFFRIESFWVQRSVAPLFVVIRVYPEMDEHAKMQIHPGFLLRRWNYLQIFVVTGNIVCLSVAESGHEVAEANPAKPA